MNRFSLTNTVFRTDGGLPVAVGVLDFNRDEVREIQFADIDKGDPRLELEYKPDSRVWELVYVGDRLETPSMAFDIDIYVEFIETSGQHRNAMAKFRIFGITETSCLPEIQYIENLATRVGSSTEVVLHCHNLTYSNTDGLSVFLISESSYIRIKPEDIYYDMKGDDMTACSSADQTASFVLQPSIFGGDDERCGTYEIRFGYGDNLADATLLPNSVTTRNLALVRYKYDGTEENGNDISGYTGEGKCWSASPISLVSPVMDDGNAGVQAGAGESVGDEIYVKVGSYDCPCTEIKYYYVKLVYNRRLEYRRGEMVLDGVHLRTGDIVWLSAQNDGTDGLWEVSTGDWQGLGTPVNGDGHNPCFSINPPLPVNCAVFIDPGVRVTENVQAVCAETVVKNGTQDICGMTVQPGDIVALTNQQDGGDGLWRVLCGDWEFLGSDYDIDGKTVDLSRAVIVQNNIDFCKCGGIFHIDYYYLNASCVLNHARRTVKIMCEGASIVPNTSKQVIVTDYRISDGVNAELVRNTGSAAGEPEPEDCMLVDENFDHRYSLKTQETRKDCTYEDGVLSPDCREYCDCGRYYTVSMGADYSTSSDSDGFTVLFWQRRNSKWHLYAYVASGNYQTGMDYYVMHLCTEGVAVSENIDYNREVVTMRRDALGNIVRDASGGPETTMTHDAWFVPHPVFDEVSSGDDAGTREDKERKNDAIAASAFDLIADGFGLVDDAWEFVLRDGYGEKIPGHYTKALGPDNLYDMWRITPNTKFLCTIGDEGIEGMRGVWGFRYYKSVIPASEFVRVYNSVMCR